MDGSPFRAPQSADRRATSRSEPTRWQPEDQQPVATEPEAVRATPQPRHVPIQEKTSKKRPLLPIFVIILVLLLGAIGWLAWSNSQNNAGGVGIDGGKYQAVFFTNGQVYFGKLKASNNDYMQLTDIYYLQTQATSDAESDNLQKTSTDQNNVQLIKLGDEIHGPEDKMVISRDQVLFYENLKADGKVAQSIEEHKKSN